VYVDWVDCVVGFATGRYQTNRQVGAGLISLSAFFFPPCPFSLLPLSVQVFVQRHQFGQGPGPGLAVDYDTTITTTVVCISYVLHGPPTKF
jgi:hypothetical protein